MVSDGASGHTQTMNALALGTAHNSLDLSFLDDNWEYWVIPSAPATHDLNVLPISTGILLL